jgi:hypothetical protein
VAGRNYTIDLGGEGEEPPWSTLAELASATQASEWVLFGGLMVQVHALRAGITPSRPTRDVDLVIDVQARASNVASVSGAIRQLGFIARMPSQKSSPLHRFERGREQIDIMVPDHLPAHSWARVLARPVMAVDAGSQAMGRRDHCIVRRRTSSFAMDVPDVIASLIAKGAAFRSDLRDKTRHISDCAVLLASADGLEAIDFEELTKNDRRRLRFVFEPLDDPFHAAWSAVRPAEAATGRQRMRLIRAAAALG